MEPFSSQQPGNEARFTELDQHYMQMAIELARQAEQQGEVPIGAVLVKDQQVIATGYNQSISLCDPCAHAEVNTLRQAGKTLNNYRLLDTTLYVTLEPCPMCAGALLHARVTRIVYGAPDLKAGAAGTVIDVFNSPAAFHYAQVEGGLLEDECKSLLQNFFKRRRKEIKQQKQKAKLTGPQIPKS
ncbi:MULTISPECIES: tRNA adenosine(34) deaminase TadA [unclassified Vibrio]|uniref:tRNA-specific adenosine deaminase n=1 Tax=Vibrio sp. HB236076 TaxID=3232307 RepID=A0AB39HF92_9VIBR|nr:tRNA adenosine(34) deaminase TadA [Vibrio sp. HB161653]MDP5254163.1 tRNA adenosine(34) deaminase TadA [Vibrio sp. HB161653]